LHNERSCPEKLQTHTHEFEASTMLAEQDDERHNHRFAGVTSQAIRVPGGHIVNALYFSKVIKARTGISPSHYRKNANINESLKAYLYFRILPTKPTHFLLVSLI
jgi:hypothetical protein